MKILPRLYHGVPFLSLLGFLFTGSSLKIGGFPLLPTFFLAPLYYWILFRPDDLPLWSLWGLGLIYDALLGNPLWVSPLLLIASWIGGQYARPLVASYKFPLLWVIFCLYSFVYLFFYNLGVRGGIAFFVSWIYGVCLYPLIASLLSVLHVRLRPSL